MDMELFVWYILEHENARGGAGGSPTEVAVTAELHHRLTSFTQAALGDVLAIAYRRIA